MSTLAGSGKKCTEDGVGVNASFSDTKGIAINQATGDIYVSESTGNVIRKISPQGRIVEMMPHLHKTN